MNLELLKRFYIVAEEGTIGRAAHKLNIVPSALTRSISDFEYHLKAKLFERVPKGMKLTPQGERLYVFAKQFLPQADNFERIFKEEDDEIEGEIRILTTPYVGVHWLIPHMKGFIRKHPKITLKILFNNKEFESLEDADVGIGPFISHQPHLSQEILFTLSLHLFASHDYLKEFGVPEKPEDLDHHRIISYTENYYPFYGSWSLNIGRSQDLPPRTPILQIDTLDGMVKAALQGMGIIEAPNLTSLTDLGLQKILPQIKRPQISYYFIFPKNMKSSKKINSLFKYLAKKGK